LNKIQVIDVNMLTRKHRYFAIFLFSVFCTHGCKYMDSTSNTPPEANRFTLVELAKGLDEPMELEFLPDGDILVIERKGAIKRYSQAARTMNTIDTLPVFHGLEDGLLGMALDPAFERNRWIYLFYSPVGDKPIQQVSRFSLDGNPLALSNEKKLLEIPVQREECCHSAGSLEFGPDGMLFIAVGDNTNPHNQGYYNSIDERPGREYWDAQRTAANTNDLRGKVLRIKPEDDGTYSIPKGNLFPEGTPKTRPEIYAMGCRNPYRIAVDPKTGWLLWGDVGQNTVDDPSRGPISYDEWHLAKEPGFFGWPYFAGPNAPYSDFDYATGVNGPFYEVEKPINNSPNNTGLQELPPAKPALIWYSYDESKEFDHLGTGGKTPIAGPVYHHDRYPTAGAAADRKFPAYYDGKWFIAEWMRDWINVITLNDKGELVHIEPFLPDETFHHPIDLQFGSDGALYVLDYGTNWFSKNADSRLVRIEYEAGNRKPIVSAGADVTAGAAPLTVHFSSEGTFDHDKNDRLTYAWEFGPGIPASSEPNPVVTFEEARVYPVTLRVTDSEGATASETLRIQVGNSPPEFSLDFEGNRSFYWDNRELNYRLQVNDKEDGSLHSGIDPASVKFYRLYGKADVFSESGAATSAGLELILNSDCRSCHALNEVSVGPSYYSIAQRYTGDSTTVDRLAKTIISGGSGVWGERVMSAHPQLTLEEATAMVKYILSISEVKIEELPLQGKHVFNLHPPEKAEQENYTFKAAYTDRGNAPATPLTTESSWTFRPTQIGAITCDDHFQCDLNAQTRTVRFNKDKAYILFRDIDLTGIRSLTLGADTVQAEGKVEIRMGKPDGELLGQAVVDSAQQVTIPLSNRPVTSDIYVVYRREKIKSAESGVLHLNWIRFNR